VTVSCTNDLVSFDARVCNLAGDVSIGEANNQTVLGSVVFVLVLNDESLTCIVVSFSLATPLEFNLEPLEILLVFNNFNKTLKLKTKNLITSSPRTKKLVQTLNLIRRLPKLK